MTASLRPLEDRRGTDTDGHDVVEPLYVGIVTVSSSRSAADDPGGDAAAAVVKDGDHDAEARVTVREHVTDDVEVIREVVGRLADCDDVDCVVTTGGTGVTVDDVTPEACGALFDRSLPGFGELFRVVSYEAIGHRAMASRAVGGIVGVVPVFCLPGSVDAVETALTELIVPEAPHLAGLATRHRFESV